MLQSIGASQGVPPFLKSLASSLQLLQLQHSTPHTTSQTHDSSSAGHGGAGANIPQELSQMMDAFKQMRPPPPPVTDDTTDGEQSQADNGGAEELERGREASSCHGDEGEMNEHIAKLLEERLSELERRLEGYVDSKLAELEVKLVGKLDKLSGRVDRLNQQSLNIDSTQCNSVHSNGIPLSEDQLLD